MTFDPVEVERYCAARIPDLKKQGRELRAPCPVHHGKDPNFSIAIDTGLATCHSQCGRGWDLISLEQELRGCDFAAAKDRVYEIVGRPKVPYAERLMEATYDYVDAKGKLLYQVCRFVGKDFRQRSPAPAGGWLWSLKGIERVPYRLDKLAAAETVFIVEGEKDVHTLERLGVTATCNSGGAGKFSPSFAPYFAGKTICVLGDNDKPGREHALQVAAIVAPVARSVKIVELPGVPLKGDVSDWVASGGTLPELRRLYQQAVPWTEDWSFAAPLPNEHDRWIKPFQQVVDEAGGLTAFLDLTRLVGLETPWKQLNYSLGGGFRAGEVYALGANQGAGKTSLALQIVLYVVAQFDGVLFFSMEMSHEDVFRRCVSIQAEIDLQELRHFQIVAKSASDPGERVEAAAHAAELLKAAARAAGNLTDLPLFVCTKPTVTVEDLIALTKERSARQPIRLVVVDHMQLMSSTGNEQNDYQKFTAISRAMKSVAVELNAPVLLISQTSRKQAFDRRAEVEISDLRGSGAIEEDAAAVLLLYEDKADCALAKQEDRYATGPIDCTVKLAKNRYGESGREFRFRHHKRQCRFELLPDAPPKEPKPPKPVAVGFVDGRDND